MMFGCSRASRLKLVSKFHDVHVHAETGRSVEAGIGEVLGTKPGKGVREWIDANSRRRDDLNRASEVLCPEFVVAEKPSSRSGVEGNKSPPAAQCEIRYERHDQTALTCTLQ